MVIKAAAVPYILAATAVASAAAGVMAYRSSSQAAALASQQADETRRLAQAQAEQQSLQIASEGEAVEAEQLTSREMDVERRRKATALSQQAQAQAASRGYIALPIGSFGAILGGAEEELHQDLEASRKERAYARASGEFSLASLQMQRGLDYRTALMTAKGYEGKARSARLSAYASLFSSLSSSARLWPTAAT